MSHLKYFPEVDRDLIKRFRTAPTPGLNRWRSPHLRPAVLQRPTRWRWRLGASFAAGLATVTSLAVVATAVVLTHTSPTAPHRNPAPPVSIAGMTPSPRTTATSHGIPTSSPAVRTTAAPVLPAVRPSSVPTATPVPIPPGPWVALTGSDANPCTAAQPCLSFDRAYHIAAPGQTVKLAGGNYPGQSLSYDASKLGATTSVVFQPAPGATVVAITGELSIRTSNAQPVEHIEFDNMHIADIYARYSQHIAFRNVSMGLFFFRSTVDMQVIGGENSGSSSATSMVGAVSSTDPPAQNTLINGVSFHDFSANDCLTLQEIAGLTVENSTFTRCRQYDVALNGASNSVDFRNNRFDATSSYYSVDSSTMASTFEYNSFGLGIAYSSNNATGCGNKQDPGVSISRWFPALLAAC